MAKKIGLVIQGPLTSIGRTGNNLHASPEKLNKEGGIVQYDCRSNIEKIIKDFGHLFSEIVISTWDNEVKPGESFVGAKLISAPDPGGIKQVGHYKDNNKHRQFISTLNGLKELEKSDIEYAVKTRTDIYLDFDKLLKSFFASDTRKIGATVVHPPTFLLHDLYFVAELKILKEFCEAIEAYQQFEFISSVHREMILKHAYSLYRREIGVPDWAYFPFSPPSGVSRATREIFDYMFNKVYFSLDPEIFRKTLWRGTYYEKKHVSGLVEAKQAKTRKYNIPILISIDWKRYYHFRELTTGRRVPIVNKVYFVVGRWGWDLWSIARKVANMVR